MLDIFYNIPLQFKFTQITVEIPNTFRYVSQVWKIALQLQLMLWHT